MGTIWEGTHNRRLLRMLSALLWLTIHGTYTAKRQWKQVRNYTKGVVKMPTIGFGLNDYSTLLNCLNSSGFCIFCYYDIA